VNGECVLVVDDDADVRESIQDVLLLHGYRVLTAADGEEALAQLRSGEHTSLIILDLMMPGMSGEQFRQEQLRDPKLASTPVVLLSGAAKLSEKARRLGVDMLPKPVTLDALLEAVRRHLPDRASTSTH